MEPNAKNVDEYIARHSKEIKERLKNIRAVIRKAAPDAKETISYGMPAYKLNGMLLFFAAHLNHIGFYPLTTGIKAFKKELAGFKMSKGSVQFPFERPLPLGLIARVVKFRVKENLEKTDKKKSSKTAPKKK